MAGGELRLRDVTLTKGKAPEDEYGGAIRVRGGARVALEEVTFSENSAFNGGAIATAGAGVDLSITGSTFLRNSASSFGGALFLEGGTIDIRQSSFQKNWSDYYAGAIAAHEGVLTVSNSSFQGNSAYTGGVIEVFQNEVTLTHVTMIDNLSVQGEGAAIHRTAGAVNLYNSIVSGSANLKACTGSLTRASGNLSHDGSCSLSGARKEAKVGKIEGEPGWFPLLDGSPALDAADPEFCLPVDQVGTPRPQGGGCDVGAIESMTAQLAPTAIVPPPGCPLHDAINAANRDAPSGACKAGSGHDTITLDGDVFLREPLPPITSEITIEGNGYRINGAGLYRVFDVHRGNLTLKNLILTGGKAANGGAIRLREQAQVSVEQATFMGNSAENGGAIATMNGSARATIRNSVFERNKAQTYGGAVQALHGTVNVSDSSFESNSAGVGGALQAEYGSYKCEQQHIP